MEIKGHFMIVASVLYITLMLITPQGSTHKRSSSTIGLPDNVFGDGIYYVHLTRAIAEKGRLSVYENVSEVGGWYVNTGGYSMGRDGRIYIAFSPGFSLIALPFYIIGGMPAAYLMNVIIGLATIYFMYKTCRLFVDEDTAAKTALIFGFCTTIFTYSQAYYPDTLNSLLVIASFYHLTLWSKKGGQRNIIASGAIAGLTPLVRPTLLLVALAYFSVLCVRGRRLGAVMFAASMIPGLLLFMAYNTVAFGSPLSTSYSSQFVINNGGGVEFKDQVGLSAWGNNLVKAFTVRMILLCLTQPVILASIVGLIRERDSHDIRVIAATSMLMLLTYSMRGNPLGIWCWSDRLATGIIPLLSVPFAITMRKKQVAWGLLMVLTYASLYLTIMSLDTGSWYLFSQFPLVEWIME
ncbi:MAG: glycosyltransferase family 39 protein [Candidatus Altiarchaeota archaeon]